MATLRFGLLPSEPLKINSIPFENFQIKPLRIMVCCFFVVGVVDIEVVVGSGFN
jgi:hypothetical protein